MYFVKFCDLLIKPQPYLNQLDSILDPDDLILKSGSIEFQGNIQIITLLAKPKDQVNPIMSAKNYKCLVELEWSEVVLSVRKQLTIAVTKEMLWSDKV